MPKLPSLSSLMGDLSRPANGGEVPKSKEKLDEIIQVEAPSVPYRLTVEGKVVEMYTPPAVITTNSPIETAVGASLNDKVPVLGYSSFRNDRNREDLEGARARVLVADYGEYGRVIVVNSPVSKTDHLAQDAVAHTLAVEVATGQVVLGGVVADGNTNVYVRENLVPKGISPVSVDKKQHTALIPATGSARYADIPARNAFRIPAFLGKLPQLADTFVAHIDRNPDYIGVFGGSTAQMLAVKFDFGERSMELDFLGLGEGKDFGALEIGLGAQAKGVMLVGNDQDISFEGRVPGYDVGKLRQAQRGEKYPFSVLQMTSDGIKPLAVKFPDGLVLEDVLYGDPQEVVAYLAGSSVFGKAHDDESLLIYVPPRPEAVTTLQEVAVDEAVAGGGQATQEEQTVVGGDAVKLEVKEADESVVFEEAPALSGPEAELAARVEELEDRLQAITALVDKKLVGERVSTKELAEALGLEVPPAEEKPEAVQALAFFTNLLGEENATKLMDSEPGEVLTQIYTAVAPVYQKLDALRDMVVEVWKGRALAVPKIEELFGFDIDPELKKAYNEARKKDATPAGGQPAQATPPSQPAHPAQATSQQAKQTAQPKPQTAPKRGRRG